VRRFAFVVLGCAVAFACTSTEGLTSPDGDWDDGGGAGEASAPDLDGATTDGGGGDGRDAQSDADSSSPAAAYRAMIVGDGPVAYWRFDEATGSKIKDEMGSYDGTAQGGLTLGEPSPSPAGGTAIRFAGTTGNVSMGPVLDFVGKSEISIEAWVNIDVLDNDYRRVISKRGSQGGYAIFCHADYGGCALEIVTGGGPRTCTIALATNKWFHVAGTYDGVTMRGYLDGVEACNAVTNAGTFGAADGALVVGMITGTGNYLKGAVDELAIYEKVLPAARFKAHRDAMIFQ
jgi:hypothetical protein